MSNRNKWLIGVGILAGLLILFALPFIWQALSGDAGYGPGYGMMRYGRMPMMHGYAPMHGSYGYGGFSFMMFLAWLIPTGLLVLIGLGIASLIKYLRSNS